MNPFQKIKDKIQANVEQKSEEQRQRIERLAQLEAAQNHKGFHIPNPVQSMKDKKEIKRLKKEIAAFEESKRNTKIIIGCVLFVVTLICFCGIMAAIEGSSQPAETVALDDYHEEETMESTVLSTEVYETSSVETLATEPTVTETEAVETLLLETTVPTETVDCTQISASNLSVTTRQDYAHTDTDVIFLGNQEGVTISIVASVPNLTWEDLVLIYDESLLQVQMQTPTGTESSTTLKAYFTGKKAGEAELFICTKYDLIIQGENVEGYLLDIRKLDSTEGRIVYVTQTGEKYHFSENCAGDGAVKTTYRDATAYEYEPCGKCAG